jgi:hypothetical protein
MKIRELIEILTELPQDATIGTIDRRIKFISDYIGIYSKNSEVYCSGELVKISDIEMEGSNVDRRKCDYYIE